MCLLLGIHLLLETLGCHVLSKISWQLNSSLLSAEFNPYQVLVIDVSRFALLVDLVCFTWSHHHLKIRIIREIWDSLLDNSVLRLHRTTWRTLVLVLLYCCWYSCCIWPISRYLWHQLVWHDLLVAYCISQVVVVIGRGVHRNIRAALAPMELREHILSWRLTHERDWKRTKRRLSLVTLYFYRLLWLWASYILLRVDHYKFAICWVGELRKLVLIFCGLVLVLCLLVRAIIPALGWLLLIP